MRFLGLMAMMCATSAMAEDDTIRLQEQVRLDGYHASAGKAILQALSQGSLGDVDLLQEALEGVPLAPLATTLAGEWDCRTIKMGGITPLTTYAPFHCVITPDGTAFSFKKTSGSQRTSGRVILKDRTMIYLGVGYVADEDPMKYEDLPPENFGDGTYQPQVGVVEQVAPNKARILFPAPVNESDFDLLYLTRPAPAQEHIVPEEN